MHKLFLVSVVFLTACSTMPDDSQWYNLSVNSNFEKDNYECEVEADQAIHASDFGGTIERAQLRARCMNIRGWRHS